MEKTVSDGDLVELWTAYGHLWRPMPRSRPKRERTDGMKQREVAAELGLTVNEVKRIEYSALRKLRRRNLGWPEE